MSRRLGVLVVLVAALVVGLVLLTPQRQTNAPDHRSDSYAADGSSALYALASRLGHRPTTIRGRFSTPGSRGVMFVFTPDQPFTETEAGELSDWVARGGTLVYADVVGDPTLDGRLDVNRAGTRGFSYIFRSAGSGTETGPFLAGVRTVSLGDLYSLLDPGRDQIPILSRAPSGGVVAMESFVGDGRLVVLSAPLAICNGQLGSADNATLAADLISLAGPGEDIAFDEYHHGVGAPSPSPLDWATTAWGGPIAWALLVAYIGFLLRGRAFGPPIPVAPRADRSSAEFAGAVGRLLRRTGARDVTLRLLIDSVRRSLAERVGVGHTTSASRLDAVLAQRSATLSEQLRSAEQSATSGQKSDRGLLAAAQQLHDLAYSSRR